jgi:hypothetical protein
MVSLKEYVMDSILLAVCTREARDGLIAQINRNIITVEKNGVIIPRHLQKQIDRLGVIKNNPNSWPEQDLLDRGDPARSRERNTYVLRHTQPGSKDQAGCDVFFFVHKPLQLLFNDIYYT